VKVVLDTNVFVSGVFFSGPPHQILQAWRGGKLQLVISPEIFDEYSRVGEELGEQFPEVDLRPVLELVIFTAEMVTQPIHRSRYAATPMTTSSSYARFRHRAKSLSAETSIYWSNQVTPVSKY
jgi:PIN domain